MHVPASASPFPARLRNSTCLLKTGLQTLPLRYKKTEGGFLHPRVPGLRSAGDSARLLEKDGDGRAVNLQEFGTPPLISEECPFVPQWMGPAPKALRCSNCYQMGCEKQRKQVARTTTVDFNFLVGFSPCLTHPLEKGRMRRAAVVVYG